MNNFDLICVGNAIVDIVVNVEDSFLTKFDLIKGSMKLVSNQEFSDILMEIYFQTFPLERMLKLCK